MLCRGCRIAERSCLVLGVVYRVCDRQLIGSRGLGLRASGGSQASARSFVDGLAVAAAFMNWITLPL